MTVQELIEELMELRAKHGPEAEVKLEVREWTEWAYRDPVLTSGEHGHKHWVVFSPKETTL